MLTLADVLMQWVIYLSNTALDVEIIYLFLKLVSPVFCPLQSLQTMFNLFEW